MFKHIYALCYCVPVPTDLFHHRLGRRPQQRGLLKLLLLHGLPHRLRCTADVRQAGLVQQRLHTARVTGQTAYPV